MERSPLNFFQPFESLAAGHENQLTRALLLLLKLSPIAHETWLTRVAGSKHLWELPEAEFETQKRAIKIEAVAEEPIPLVSVFLTPAPTSDFDDSKVLVESDRTQVLDAIISYPGEQVVVVENKIAEADDWQAVNINITGVAVKIADGQKPIRILWPNLLADLTRLHERQLAGGTEAAILSDFLEYVEDHFPGLGPDQTLRLCAGNKYRTYRRLRSVLAEALDVEARVDGWGPCVDTLDLKGVASRAYLIWWETPDEPDEDFIALAISPADTLTQAWELYSRAELVERVRKLAEQPGWSAKHNFHFGHMQAGYAWTSGHIDLDSYLDLWVNEIDTAGQVQRKDWDKYYKWLIEKSIATRDDRTEFDKHFTKTDRKTATPRPGLEVVRYWHLADAEQLDDDGRFATEVAAAYNTIVATFG